MQINTQADRCMDAWSSMNSKDLSFQGSINNLECIQEKKGARRYRGTDDLMLRVFTWSQIWQALKQRATAEDIFHYIKEYFDRKKRTVAKFKRNFSCKSKSTPHKILAISE